MNPKRNPKKRVSDVLGTGIRKVRPVYYEVGEQFFRSPYKFYEEIEPKSIDWIYDTEQKKYRKIIKNPVFGGEIMELNPRKKRIRIYDILKRRKKRKNPLELAELNPATNIVYDIGTTSLGAVASLFIPQKLGLTGIKKYLAQAGTMLILGTLGKNIFGTSLAKRLSLGVGVGLGLTIIKDVILKEKLTLGNEIAQNEYVVVPESELKELEQKDELPELELEQKDELPELEQKQLPEYIEQQQLPEYIETII